MGAVGAYDWNGAVLKETPAGKIIPARSSYLEEFPESLQNHAAYLGRDRRPHPPHLSVCLERETGGSGETDRQDSALPVSQVTRWAPW